MLEGEAFAFEIATHEPHRATLPFNSLQEGPTFNAHTDGRKVLEGSPKPVSFETT